VDIAPSLLAAEPVDLSDALPDVDRRDLQLVITAMAHAAVPHERSHPVVEEDGSMATSGTPSGACPSTTSSGPCHSAPEDEYAPEARDSAALLAPGRPGDRRDRGAGVGPQARRSLPPVERPVP
jgi:hypothetical protein